MTKQLGKNLYLLDHSKKNILVNPRNPASPPEIKWCLPPIPLADLGVLDHACRHVQVNEC